jgi:hypothetical protein
VTVTLCVTPYIAFDVARPVPLRLLADTGSFPLRINPFLHALNGINSNGDGLRRRASCSHVTNKRR